MSNQYRTVPVLTWGGDLRMYMKGNGYEYIKKTILCLILALLVYFTCMPVCIYAWDIHLRPEREWGVLMGYGYQWPSWAQSTPEEVRLTTFYPTFGLLNIRQGDWKVQLEIEGIFGYRTNEEKGVILGASPVIRIMNTRPGIIIPYVNLGAGGTYNDMNLTGMGSRWNFSLEGGAGAQLNISSDLSLRFEYRLLHLSNAGLAEENRALNANLVLVGIWYSF